MLNEYMQNARVCCWQCGKSFAPERMLQTHEARHHPAAIVRRPMQPSPSYRENPEMGSGRYRDPSEARWGSADDVDVCSVCGPG